MTALDITRIRPVIESEIDRLIGILDLLEPDPDFEDGADLEADTADDEPLHGAPNQSAGSWKGFDASAGGDNGEELELGWTELEARFGRYQAAGGDVYEPSLASNGSINQEHWSKGRTDDREDEFDGREEDSDRERTATLNLGLRLTIRNGDIITRSWQICSIATTIHISTKTRKLNALRRPHNFHGELLTAPMTVNGMMKKSRKTTAKRKPGGCRSAPAARLQRWWGAAEFFNARSEGAHT